jgi:hypothetical protein
VARLSTILFLTLDNQGLARSARADGHIDIGPAQLPSVPYCPSGTKICVSLPKPYGPEA